MKIHRSETILFKGAVARNSENIFDKMIVYGDLVHYGGKCYIHPNNAMCERREIEKDIIMLEVIPETICQRTVYSDMYGKSLWEQDIVRWYDAKSRKLKEGAIKYREECAGLVLACGEEYFCFNETIAKSCEKIESVSELQIEYKKIGEQLFEGQISPDEHVRLYNMLMKSERHPFGPPAPHEHI